MTRLPAISRPESGALAAKGDEFPPGAGVWPRDLSRRRFLELVGASLTLAGLGGCYRPPRDPIVPYVNRPENLIPGIPQFYATAMPWQGFARGILVESHEGRPTKIEGNPDHPDSLGATDAVTQAAILNLYDPDRSAAPTCEGAPSTWSAFGDEWRSVRSELSRTGGEGLVLVTEPTTSPTVRRLVLAVLDRFPQARWYQHTACPAPRDEPTFVDFDASEADVILAADHDFLGNDPAALRHARRFAWRRTPPLNRLYVAEPTPTVTGSMADSRRALSPLRCAAALGAIAAALRTSIPPEDPWLAQVAADLRAAGSRGLCLAGAQLAPSARRSAAEINRLIGSTVPRTHPWARSDRDPRCAGELDTLVASSSAALPRALFLLSVNPVCTAPAPLGFAGLLGSVPFAVHLGEHRDETGWRCRWHLPESHFLETWSDLRATTGVATILQPLTEPHHDSRSVAGLLDLIACGTARDDLALVRETWNEPEDWDAWLRLGVVPGTAADPVDEPGPAPERADGDSPAPEGPVVLFRPSPHLHDGRWANNPWLQELPDPFTRIVWGNAALIDLSLAREHGLTNGDRVRIGAGGRLLEVPVWIQPGQAAGCVTLTLGYGRTVAGTIGSDVGFDAGRLRGGVRDWELPLSTFTPTGGRTDLISTQDHFLMEGRDLVREEGSGSPASEMYETEEPRPSLFPARESVQHAWAMAIDLATCTGCQACVVACQAENNIPSVGPEQVARGREMHWIRVDRYYRDDPAGPAMLHQPVPCMHCENAPCELVCPVAATVHSSEGLNDMVYNRCIGTRYCSNNCPYKVRRFNFLDFRPTRGSSRLRQANPDVTVRERGVMEKCTYCVQRINAARIAARREDRRIRDGEVVTACQQACPTEAIVFGDLMDPNSAVAGRRRDPRHYALLAELNTRPRTTYLARTANAPGANRL